MKSIKSRYELKSTNANNYSTLSVSSSGLTDKEFKEGKQGYIYAPYISVQKKPEVIELPSYDS